MLSKVELKKIASTRLKDAEILHNAHQYDGCVYLCGYVIEIMLKLRICKTLKWTGYPVTNGEFQNLQSFKTHNLPILLKLSGIEDKVRQNYLVEWSLVTNWNPELRYEPVGTKSDADSLEMLNVTKLLIKVL